MLSRTSFIPSCRVRALQRNRCQSQYEEVPRFRADVGGVVEHWLFPSLPFSRSSLPIFFPRISICLSIYLPSLACTRRTRVRFRRSRIIISVFRAGRRIGALSICSASERESACSPVASFVSYTNSAGKRPYVVIT